MITPEELIQDLINFYGYEVDLSYAINYIDMVGQYAEVDSFHLWLQELRLCKLNCVMLYSHSISSVGERPAPRGGTTRPDECKITTI